MKNVLFCVIIAFSVFNIYSQDANRQRNIFKVWVDLNHEIDIRGYLVELKDSSVVIIDNLMFEKREIKISAIKQLKFRSKGRIGRGLAIGAGTGLVLGVIGGYADGDDEPGFLSLTAEDKAIGLGFTMLTIGGGIGAIVGAIKKKYKLNGQQESYNSYRGKMNRYVLRINSEKHLK